MRPIIKKRISARALEHFKALVSDSGFYSALRRLKYARQEQIAALMHMTADYTLNFMRLLVAASRPSDFVEKKPRTRGVTNSEAAAIEKNILALEKQFLNAAASYPDNSNALAVNTAYLRKVIRNPRIASYLSAVHPEILADLRSATEWQGWTKKRL